MSQKNTHVDDYDQMYKKSIDDPSKFWGDLARADLTWHRSFDTARAGTFANGDIRYFVGGQLNVSVNCIDRHVDAGRGQQVAIIHEGDEPADVQKVTYDELFLNVNRWANMLRELGVGKGDTVAIYLPNIPQAAYAMLACSRIGAVHSVIFAGFSSRAVRDRINDARCSVVITADEGVRAGRVVPLKVTVDEAVIGCPCVRHVVLVKRTGAPVPTDSKTVIAAEMLPRQRPYAVPEVMDSEDPLFILYTSGSTGKPKGIVHTQAGYLLYAQFTQRAVFDVRPGDVWACVADVGWITGHSYVVYAPLCNGGTTVMFESTPLYPDASRYWDMVERHRITQFYTAPTAIRALMKFGEEPVQKHDLSSLRTLGTVGEPINPAAWNWYHRVVGAGKCDIIDTYWQTETGGFIITPFSGVTAPLKAGSATKPMFGVNPQLLHPTTGEVIQGEGEGLVAINAHWPGIARTILGDHARYLKTYMGDFPGYYLTGDGAKRDADGYFWITGRTDDVINKAGHRLGTAEIESALVASTSCVEAAVVAIPHDVKGQQIVAYCLVRHTNVPTSDLTVEMKQAVRTGIGAIAVPDTVLIAPGLPKTRSGKIMRRLLRKIAEEAPKDSFGDISTLADPSVVDKLIAAFAEVTK